MSGHSKWSTIKRQKAVKDAKRGAAFTKLAKEITIAAKIGGGSVDGNFRLRLAVQKGREANMPNSNIERAIKKGTGEGGESVNYEEVTYEGYGPAGVAVLVDIMTDNRNRASSSIRHIFSSNGGNLGETGCVAWMFETKGVIILKPKNTDLENAMLELIDLGSEDVTEAGEGNLEIICAPDQLETVKNGAEKQGNTILSSEITQVPKNTVKIEDKKTAEQIFRLLDELEENEDVQKTYANFDIPEEILNA
ncbi:MAG: YebC/PmpR family DNA-binding transcriptional regulator [bacterium]